MQEVLELQKALDTSLESSVFIALCRKVEKRNKRLARDLDSLHEKNPRPMKSKKRLVALRKRIKPMPAKLSRLATLIEQEKVRPDLEVKTCMDTLRMIARNFFSRHLKSFQPHYDSAAPSPTPTAQLGIGRHKNENE